MKKSEKKTKTVGDTSKDLINENSETEKSYRLLYVKRKLTYLWGFLPIAVFLVSYVFHMSIFIIWLPPIICCFPYLYFRRRAKNRLNAFYSNEIVAQSVTDTFIPNEAVFLHKQMISPLQIYKTGLFDSTECNVVRGSDFISGAYGGISFEQSNIYFANQKKIVDRKGNTHKIKKILFHGRWLVLHYPVFRGKIVIVEKNERFEKLNELDFNYKTGNEAFDCRFGVVFEDCSEEAVKEVLMPKLIDYLLNLHKKRTGRLLLCFYDEKINIALFDYMNTFMVGRWDKSLELLKKRAKKELFFIIDCINAVIATPIE